MLNTLSVLADFLSYGFLSSTLLLLPVYALVSAARPVLNRLSYWSNAFLLVGASVSLLLTAWQLLPMAWVATEEDWYLTLNRLFGPYWFAYWGAVLANGLLPQVLWWRRLRSRFRTSAALAGLMLLVLLLPALANTLHRDYLPSSWAMQPAYLVLALSAVPYGLVVSLVYLVANRQRSIL